MEIKFEVSIQPKPDTGLKNQWRNIENQPSISFNPAEARYGFKVVGSNVSIDCCHRFNPAEARYGFKAML